MRDLPARGAKFIWTANGPAIVKTDAQGDVVDTSMALMGKKFSPQALLAAALAASPMPDAGAGSLD